MVIFMSALYTHYKLGQDVLRKLNKKTQAGIKNNLEYYNMFNQGFDNLYYHFKWKYYKDFGINAHKKKIDLFFFNLIKHIKDNNLENCSIITNMVYGFINHYTLDTIIHPYINFQVKNLDIPHTKIEFLLDSLALPNSNVKVYKILIPKLKFSKELIDTIDYVFYKTHNENNIGKVFNRSHNNGYYIYRYFIHDKYGIKSFIYKIVDLIIPFLDIKLHKTTFYLKQFDERILNLEKETWHHPNNINEKYNYSYEELYNIALKICVKLNKEAYQVLHGKEDLQNLINNIKLINLKNIQELLSK